MSQVYYYLVKDDVKYTIMGGWDKPLNNYHLLIEEMKPKHEEEVIVFCSIYEFDPGSPKTVEPLKNRAEELGFNIPDIFWQAVSLKKGNVIGSVDSDLKLTWQ